MKDLIIFIEQRIHALEQINISDQESEQRLILEISCLQQVLTFAKSLL